MTRGAGVVAAVAVAGVAALVACGKGSVTESHGDTTTAVPLSKSVTASEIESLVVPVDQVPGGLHNSGDVKQPQSYPSQPANACSLAYAPADDATVFGGDTTGFRAVRYSGPGNLAVVQAIGVYRDNANPSAIFQRLANGLNTCKTNGDGVSVDTVTPTSAAWHTQGFSPVKGMEETSFAAQERVVKNVLFRVDVEHFDNPQQVAASISDQIAAKINNVV